MKRLYAFAFKARNVLAGAPLLCLLASTRWEWDGGWVLWTIAALLSLAGGLLRAWSRCHCNFARRRKKVLATTGPYASSRNPLYLGNMLMIAGPAVASKLVWALPLVLAWAFFMYSLTIKHEERRLVENYGDEYLAYRERVPAWLPRRLPRRADFAVCEFVPVASLQVTSASMLLVPFVLKDCNVFSVWA